MSVFNRKSVLQFVIMLGIGVLLIWLIAKQVEPKKAEIIRAFKSADYFWILVSMLISFASHFLRAYRWNYLLEPLGHRTRLSNAVCHVLVGYFANYGIPRAGEVTRCTLAAKYDKVPFETGFGTVITERIVDTLLFIIIFFLTLFLQFDKLIGLSNSLIFNPMREKLSGIGDSPFKMFMLAFVLLAGFLVFWLARKKIKSLFSGVLGQKLKGMMGGITSIRKLKSPFAFVFLSIAIWACYFYSLYVCLFSLSGTSHLGQKECLTLLLFGTLGVIFSPGGIGAYPAILYGILFTTMGVEESASFALPWLSWAGQFILIVITGVIALILLPLLNKNRTHEVSPAAEK